MKRLDEFRKFLAGRGLPQEKVERYIESVEEAITYFNSRGIDLEKAQVEDFREYVLNLIKIGKNSYDDLMPLGRFVYMLDMKDAWIYYASILGGNTVYPSIKERLSELTSVEVCNSVFDNVDIPQLGSDQEYYPRATKQLMEHLSRELPPDQYRRVLAGNHHEIPAEGFQKQKEWFKELDYDIDKWLKKMHEEAVSDLEKHLEENKVWFEQVITQDIVDYVKGNQELLAGVIEGDWIYNLKFPYAPQEYLDAEDHLMKCYYMCHCPLARADILKSESNIPMEWCYCSAGYAKYRYDIAFEEETYVEVLESVLGGSDKCRFRILIPERWR